MPRDPLTVTDWSLVAAKSQAFLCLHHAGLREKGLAEQARFLMNNLGLTRADAAALLGTTDDSLRHIVKASAQKASPANGKEK